MARKNWITALACCALLALGACTHSDSDDKPAATADPAAPVGSAEAVNQALTTAKTFVRGALDALDEAVIPASETPAAVSQADDDSAAAATMTSKDKVREALETADKALETAVDAANAAVKAAGDDADARATAEAAKKTVDDYRAENPLKLVERTVAVWDAEDAVKADGSLENKKTLTDAKAALAEAVAALKDEDELKTALSKIVEEADELRKSLAWATSTGAGPESKGLEPGAASAAVMGEVDVVRHPRTKGAESGWKPLEIEKEGVPYAEGKFVISPDGDGTTDELPMRAFTVRQFGYEQGKNTGKDKIDNKSGTLDTSIELTEDGLVMKTGGNAVYYDMQREFSDEDEAKSVDDWALIGADGVKATNVDAGVDMTPEHLADLKKLRDAGTDVGELPESATGTLSSEQSTALKGADTDKCWDGGVTCANWAHDDLTITFGKPSQAPDGSAVWHWRARVKLPDGQDASKIVALEGRANQDLGQYDLWLSNYAGLDERNVRYRDGKPVKDQGSEADDDEYRYLSHAAYGIFQLLDNINAYGTKRPQYSRSQAFHVGYEAFASVKGERTIDLEKPITGTFEGRTMAHALHTINIGTADEPKYRPDRFESLRGDISLSATIGSAKDTITGEIDKLEYLDSGGWNKGYEVSKVSLEKGEIALDGSYKGMAKEEGSAIYTQNGSFEGNFYGPMDKPETAGWWELSKNAPDVNAKYNPEKVRRIIGSYGAVCTKGCGD